MNGRLEHELKSWVSDRMSELYGEPRLASWLATEIPRRLATKMARKNSSLPLILSYPRSGNHAIRFFLETSFGRPTLGLQDSGAQLIPRGLGDPPLYVRRGVHIQIHSRKPIARKVHKVPVIDESSAVVIAVRNPEEAILSHMADFDDDTFQARVSHEIWHWGSIIEFWKGYSGPKALITYDEILAGDVDALASIASLLEHPSPRLAAESYVASDPKGSLGALRRAPQTFGVEQSEWMHRFGQRAKHLSKALRNADLPTREVSVRQWLSLT